MSRKLIALDLALLALLVWAGLGLRSIWMAAKLREAEELRKKPAPVAVSPTQQQQNAPHLGLFDELKAVRALKVTRPARRDAAVVRIVLK